VNREDEIHAAVRADLDDDAARRPLAHSSTPGAIRAVRSSGCSSISPRSRQWVYSTGRCCTRNP
jgi:hypothetical protein